MSNISPVAVIGAGAWGTTLAVHLSTVGASVRLVARTEGHADELRSTRANARLLPGVALPDSLTITSSVHLALEDAAYVFVVVPSQVVRIVAESMVNSLASTAIVVSCAKGLERSTLARMSEVISTAASHPAEHIAVLSGPNLSGEIASGLPASAVVASTGRAAAQRVQSLLSSPSFRIYTSEDVVGVELGGALKNVIALGAGVGDGLGLGQNAKAAFITRGLAELSRLGVAMGANPMTFGGLSGLGDLIATCASPLSRNRTFGQLLSEGLAPDEAMARIGHVVEGATTAYAMVNLGREHGVSTPIADAVVAVLDGDASVTDVIQRLLSREHRPELDDAEQ